MARREHGATAPRSCKQQEWAFFALLGVFTKQPRVEPLVENTKQGERISGRLFPLPPTPKGELIVR
jgi:hypothetical protein